jgi:hypothetical protein
MNPGTLAQLDRVAEGFADYVLSLPPDHPLAVLAAEIDARHAREAQARDAARRLDQGPVDERR